MYFRYFSNGSKISNYSGIYYPDGNWNRIPGSKLKTTTIKPQLPTSGHTNNSFVLKYKQQKLISQQQQQNHSGGGTFTKSAAIYNRAATNGHQSAFNISRELSIIDLSLPVKANNGVRSSNKRNVSFNVNSDGTEAKNDLDSMAAKIISSGGLAKSSLFPSPINSDGKAPEVVEADASNNNAANNEHFEPTAIAVDSHEAALLNRNKTYTQYIMQQQKKRNMVNNPNRRSIKLFSQDISIGEGMNKLPSNNSLLIRRLKF